MDSLEEKTKTTNKHMKIHSTSLPTMKMRIWNNMILFGPHENGHIF